MAKKEPEVQHFSGTILKRNRDGKLVLGSSIEEGEEQVTAQDQEAVARYGKTGADAGRRVRPARDALQGRSRRDD